MLYKEITHISRSLNTVWLSLSRSMCLLLTIFFICVIVGDKDGRHERVPQNGAKTEPRDTTQTSRPMVHLK